MQTRVCFFIFDLLDSPQRPSVSIIAPAMIEDTKMTEVLLIEALRENREREKGS